MRYFKPICFTMFTKVSLMYSITPMISSSMFMFGFVGLSERRAERRLRSIDTNDSILEFDLGVCPTYFSLEAR